MSSRHAILSSAIAGWLMLSGLSALAQQRSVAELTKALKSSEASARLQAIRELGAHRQQAAVAVTPLVELLKDSSAEVRAHAASALGMIGAAAKSAAPALVGLLKDADPVVRREAVKAMLAIRPGPQVTVPLMVKQLEESDPGTRMHILHAITEAGPAAVPGLIEALNNDKAAYYAVLVLRELGPAAKAAVPALAARLKEGRPEFRREVALTLAAMESAAAPAAPQLAAALNDPDVAVAATYALARIGRMSREVEAKVKANVKSDDKMLSTVSHWALALTHPEDKQLRATATQQLVDRLKDKDAFVRVAAARGLASLPPAPEITLPIMEKALKGADEETIHHALDALATLGAPAVPRLIEGLKHEKVRPLVAEVLGKMGPVAASATGALAGLINDPDEHTARAAIVALAGIGPGAKQAVPALVKALGQKDRPDTFAIIYALGRIGPAAAPAKPSLTQIVADPKHEMAVVAAWALVKIDPKGAATTKAVPALTTGLNSPLAVIRRGAAEALGEMGRAAKGAEQALARATKDEEASVRDAAAKALASIRR